MEKTTSVLIKPFEKSLKGKLELTEQQKRTFGIKSNIGVLDFPLIVTFETIGSFNYVIFEVNEEDYILKDWRIQNDKM